MSCRGRKQQRRIPRQQQPSIAILENLELRRMFSSAVTVTGDGSDVLITGDDAANQIDVTAGAGGTIVVTGGKNTLVNGGKSASAPLSATLTIVLNGGDDQLNLHDVSVGDHLTVLMGDGNDQATISNVQIGSFLHFEGDAGNDSVTVINTHVSDPTFTFFSTIDMQDGDDSIKLNNFTDQDLEVTTGDGDNNVDISNCTFLGGPFQRLIVTLGNGDDNLSITNTATGPLFVDAGAGTDMVTLHGDTADSATILDTGGGLKDHAKLTQDVFGFLDIDPDFKVTGNDA